MIKEIFESIINPIKILNMKDPCKKCLINTCCSTICPNKKDLINYVYPFDLTEMKRTIIVNWLCILAVTMQTLILIIMIIKKI